MRWALALYLLMCLDIVEMSNCYIHLLMVCPSRLAGCCKQGIENYFCPCLSFYPSYITDKQFIFISPFGNVSKLVEQEISKCVQGKPVDGLFPIRPVTK